MRISNQVLFTLDSSSAKCLSATQFSPQNFRPASLHVTCFTRAGVGLKGKTAEGMEINYHSQITSILLNYQQSQGKT